MAFLPLNIAVVGFHIGCFIVEKYALVPFVSKNMLPMLRRLVPTLDYQKLSWLNVANGFFLYWATFLAYAESQTINGTDYNLSTPRAGDNAVARAVAGLTSRLYAAHENAIEDLSFFGLAVTAASVLGAVTPGGTTAVCKEVAVLATTHSFARWLHWITYALNLPNARIAAYIVGLHTNGYLFAGAILSAWTGWAR